MRKVNVIFDFFPRCASLFVKILIDFPKDSYLEELRLVKMFRAARAYFLRIYHEKCHTKDSARPRSHFLYTKNFRGRRCNRKWRFYKQETAFAVVQNVSKTQILARISKRFLRCARRFLLKIFFEKTCDNEITATFNTPESNARLSCLFLRNKNVILPASKSKPPIST